MKARITEIESGKAYNDKKRRVTITFENAAFGMNRLRVAEDALGLRDVELDMELDVEVELAISKGEIDGAVGFVRGRR